MTKNIRKCIYTNEEARAKDTIIPSPYHDDVHNWASKAPVNIEYQITKQDRMPNELELQANEVFHLLELARLRVSYYEKMLEEIQKEIKENYQKPEIKKREVGKNKEKKLKKEMEAMVKEVEIQEKEKDYESLINSKFENMKKLWE